MECIDTDPERKCVLGHQSCHYAEIFKPDQDQDVCSHRKYRQFSPETVCAEAVYLDPHKPVKDGTEQKEQDPERFSPYVKQQRKYEKDHIPHAYILCTEIKKKAYR